MFNKIVVGFDGSQMSENALRLACDLAQKYNSEIHLVHTPQPQTVAFAMGAVTGYHVATTMPSATEVKAAAEKVCAGAVAIAKEFDLTLTQMYMDSGDPADEIIACAKACGSDLIVTGRRGLGAVGALVQGSTTQRVNKLAECACLSVI